MPRIAALLLSPIEGCRGVRVKGAGVTPRGLDGDRRWQVVDTTGGIVGPRELSRVFVELRGDDLWVSAAGMERLVLPSGLASSAAWFEKLLGRPAQCVARPDAPAPLLATTTASLAGLNQALPHKLGIERFAANLVLEGTVAFEEDRWRAVRMGGARFLVTQPPEPRLAFGIDLQLEPGAAAVQLRPGQTLDVER